jgi:PAS domain S-box-containing protein
MPKISQLLRAMAHNPIRILTLGILFNLALGPIIASLVWAMYTSLAQIGTESMELQRLVGSISHLNEVSTMSARLAAVTGDPKWEAEYRRIEPELDNSLAAVATLARAEYQRNYASQAKLAYAKTIETESLAFALLRNGRKEEAAQQLLSEAYQNTRNLHSQALQDLTQAVRKNIREEIESFRVGIWKAVALVCAGVVALFAAWAITLLALKRHLAERELSEQSVFAEKERLLVTLQSIGDGVITSDTSGRAVLVNPAAEMLIGTRQEEAAGRKASGLFDIVKEGTDEKNENPVDYVLRTGTPYRLTNRTVLIAGNQDKKYIELGAEPIRDRHDKIMGVVLVIRDVTRRKQRENMLKQSEEKHRTIIQNMEEGYYEVDLAGNITSFNEAMAGILDYVPEQLSGINYREFFLEPFHETVAATFKRVLESGKPEQISGWEVLRRDGTTRSIDVSISPVLDSGGKPSGFRGIVRDVTERNKLEEQLRQAAKMEAIGTLAGGIAHDFNNILYVIMGFTELATDRLAKGSKLNSHLQQVLAAANRAKALVDQILTFSRQRAQKRQVIQTSPILKETLKFLRASVPSTVEIREKIEADVETIVGDPTQVHQVLMNLCTNAAHAMRENGGVLGVRLDNRSPDGDRSIGGPNGEPEHYLRLTVTDTGHGMTPDVLERVFEPYFTTKGKSEGTGLGLSVVHGIVKSHGGLMKVHSEVGKGSSFEVYLPVVRVQPDRFECDNTPRADGAGEHILLVDDEPAVIEMGSQMLQRLGYRVSGHCESPDALALFREDPRRFDLVITDLTMPKMTGKELALELRRVRPDIPIILCTGFSESVSEEQVQKLGFSAIVTKPVSPRDMAAKICSVLEVAS